jgi:hypothetical protein
MRLALRLGALAVALAAMAMGLVHLRAQCACTGNQLHALYRHRRQLEKSCWQLHLAVADLKNVDRLRARAADFPGLGPPDLRQRAETASPRPLAPPAKRPLELAEHAPAK